MKNANKSGQIRRATDWSWVVFFVVVVWAFLMGWLVGSLWPETRYIYEKPVNIVRGEVSAYTSSPDETDDTPCITASGAVVGEGIVANNCFEFGQVVRISGKNYIVQDRLNKRYECNHFDIWFRSKAEAREFGRQFLRVIIKNL